MSQQKKKKMAPKKERFAKEFPVDLSAASAAIRSGYSEKTARQIGSRLLSEPEVQEAIAKEQEKISKRIEINQDYVVKSLKQVADQCMEGDNWNPQAANKSLELLGKHLGIFVDKKQLDHTFSLGQLAAELESDEGSGE